jgi:diguanylate cyclase (GGDEF)-like protein/PAS domain S-box-containing protein
MAKAVELEAAKETLASGPALEGGQESETENLRGHVSDARGASAIVEIAGLKMSTIIDRLKFQRGETILPESDWRIFLDEVRVYSEKLEREICLLRESRELLLTIMNLIPVAFFVKDHKSRFFLMNRACEEQWGMSFTDLRDTDASQFFPPDQMEQFLNKDKAIFEGRQPVEFEETFWSASKQSNRTGYTFKRPIYDANGDPQYLVCVTLDITDRKLAQEALLVSEKKLLALATTDSLTNLQNRRKFLISLTDEFEKVRRFSDQPSSVVMLDLDFFKRVNDTYGHAGGDAVLKHFAQLMHSTLRKIDTAARVGGEEFAIILPGADSAAARIFTERLREIVSKTPVKHDGKTISVTVSIGIATMDPRDSSADETLIRADEALYRAKRNGRNRVELAEIETADPKSQSSITIKTSALNQKRQICLS